jgi:RNA polymerase sigma factor (sigma-70 family)
VGTTRDLTDGQLLERFASESSEVSELAFSALVERHEAMVWRVCWAIVRDEHAAEDAFQATFLVLLRRAKSLWVRDSLGPWLHQVALRTASCMRTTIARRHKHERRCAERKADRLVDIATAREPDLEFSIQEELNRLPEKYRAPIVLCDLEGCSHREAARCLGWPIGTVKSRQAQGRELIRGQLVRRGFAVAACGAVVQSLSEDACAAPPKELVRSTVRAGMHHSARLASELGVPARVLTLTQGVLHMMLLSKVRVLVACLAVAAATGGAAVYVRGSQEPSPQEGPPISNKHPKAGEQTSRPDRSKTTGESPAATARVRLRAQQLATRKAKAEYQIARLTRELAEIALEVYEEVVYPRDLASAEGEIKLAESDLKRTQDRLDWAQRMFDKGYVNDGQKASEELGFQKAKFALEQTESKREVLVKYTKARTIKELRMMIEKARAEEQAKQDSWEIESIKELEIQDRVRRKSN